VKKFVPLIITLVVTLSVVMFLMIMGATYYINPGDSMFAAETVEIFIPFIPGTIFTDLLIMILAPIVAFFVIFYTLAPYWAKLLIKLHKILSRVGTDAKYGVVKLGKRVTGRMLFFRAMVVAFFTFSLAVFLVEILVNLGVSDAFLLYSSSSPTFDTIIQVLVACFFLGFITILIFLPVWYMEDSGLTSFQVSTKEDDDRSPVDIQGVHAPLAGVLTGYAGLATVLAWVIFIIEVFVGAPLEQSSYYAVIFFILLPLIIAGFFTIPIYLYEKKLPSLLSRLESKWNYDHIKPPTFEKIEKE